MDPQSGNDIIKKYAVRKMANANITILNIKLSITKIMLMPSWSGMPAAAGGGSFTRPKIFFVLLGWMQTLFSHIDINFDLLQIFGYNHFFTFDGQYFIISKGLFR